MSALTAGLTPKVAYEGRLDVHAHAFANNGGPVEGTLRAELTDAQLRRTRSKTRQDLIRLGSGTVTVSADRDALRSAFALDAHDLGTVSGELTAQRAGYALADMPLRGSIKAATRELDFVNIYVPDIDRAGGKLLADIAIGGTAGRPAVSGLLQLTDGEFDFYQVNLQLRKVSMQARINDNRVEFTGGAQAAEGKLDAHGDLAWREGAPHGTLQLTGKDMLLVNVPEARIVASPDLKFAVDGHRIDVTGSVTIPSARILPADLTGAVLSSSDEVIKGTRAIDPADRFLISSNIRMVLGDHVSVDTFGLSGRLTGDISAQTTVEGTSRGTGELNIADGKYAAFGRRLDVQRGRLIFSGGLLADPGLDLRATKQFPDVVAGVNVRGTLRQPRMTFFSEPALPQSQIVSLILAGGSLETAQNTDKSGVARGELLAQGGAILAQQLGQRVGVDDVSIEQSLSNETSLVLGKFLSPRLYVSYGISLAESINTIKMRYTLGDRWTIKTEAGKERSADLVYTIEK
jgi:translocation and assembly module TamB